MANVYCSSTGDGRSGKWEATGHIVKLQEASEEVTMELRDSSKLPTDTTTGEICAPYILPLIVFCCVIIKYAAAYRCQEWTVL